MTKFLTNSTNKNTQDVTRARYLARIIRSRRLQQQRTLEDLSHGVCSTSYLSKIENCAVDVEEVYYRALLEKLEMSYDNLSYNCESKHLRNVLNQFVQFSYQGIVDVASKIDNTEIFQEIECEITTLFLCCFEEKFQKCDEIIKRLESIKNTMLDDEFIIYTIAHSFYYYKTQQTQAALETLKILQGIYMIESEFVLAMDGLFCLIYHSLGKKVQSSKYSETMMNNASMIPGSNRAIVNQVLHRVLNVDTITSDFIEKYRSIDLSSFSPESKEYIGYVFGIELYDRGYHLTAYDVLRYSPLSPRIITLLSAIYENINIQSTRAHIKDIVESYQFSSTSSLFYHLTQVNVKKWKKVDDLEIMNYMKDNIFSRFPIYYESWIAKVALRSYVKVGYEAGKYKDICKLLLDKDFMEFYHESKA